MVNEWWAWPTFHTLKMVDLTLLVLGELSLGFIGSGLMSFIGFVCLSTCPTGLVLQASPC